MTIYFFLNLIFADRGLPLIEDIEIINPQLDGDSVHEKSMVLDIHARTSVGERINIEIQLRNHPGLRERALYYWSRPYSGQLQAGEEYKHLKRTVSIFLLDFQLTDHCDPHSVYQVLEMDRHEPLTDKLEIHLIELPKLSKIVKNGHRPLLNWLAFLRGAPQSEWDRLAIGEPELRKVMRRLESISKDLELWALAESRKKALHDHATLIDSAFRDGKEKGREEGKVEGIIEGVQQTKAQLALGMLNEGVSVEIVTKLTGFSAEQLVQLKNEN